MFKMLFDTGVRPESRLGVPLGQWEEWKNGTLHVAYWLEREPPPGWRVKHLCDNPMPHYLYIPIVGGGMSSKYAVFYQVT